MSLFDRFRKRQVSNARKTSGEESHEIDRDLWAHEEVVSYIRALRSGAEKNEKFEQQALSTDLGFGSLHLAMTIYTFCGEDTIPIERAVDFLRIGIPGGGQQGIATLLEQIDILMKEFNEEQTLKLLASGVVGDGDNIGPIISEFDNVEFVVKFVSAIVATSAWTDHSAIDATHGEVEEDPGWDA